MNVCWCGSSCSRLAECHARSWAVAERRGSDATDAADELARRRPAQTRCSEPSMLQETRQHGRDAESSVLRPRTVGRYTTGELLQRRCEEGGQVRGTHIGPHEGAEWPAIVVDADDGDGDDAVVAVAAVTVTMAIVMMMAVMLVVLIARIIINITAATIIATGGRGGERSMVVAKGWQQQQQQQQQP